jgi:formylglycine-generating enzyme required for sulfatase activity
VQSGRLPPTLQFTKTSTRVGLCGRIAGLLLLCLRTAILVMAFVLSYSPIVHAADSATPNPNSSAFLPTVVNLGRPSEPAPEGMVWIPGGEFSVGSAEPGISKRVQKGGSFLCTDQYCTRYMVGTRGKSDPSTATNHAGFRCVKSANQSIAALPVH